MTDCVCSVQDRLGLVRRFNGCYFLLMPLISKKFTILLLYVKNEILSVWLNIAFDEIFENLGFVSLGLLSLRGNTYLFYIIYSNITGYYIRILHFNIRLNNSFITFFLSIFTFSFLTYCLRDWNSAYKRCPTTDH